MFYSVGAFVTLWLSLSFVNCDWLSNINSRACSSGVTIDEDGREVTSPNFPYFYPNNVNCYWRILAPHGMVINVDIDSIDIENDGDYLTVSGTWKHCSFRGYYPNGFNFTTSNNYLHISFRSNGYGRQSGFRLRYRFYNQITTTSDYNSSVSPWYRYNTPAPISCPHPVSRTTNSSETTAGYTSTSWYTNTTMSVIGRACAGGIYLYNDDLEITSPNYPSPYSDNLRCEWHIRAPSGKVVNFRIRSLDLERHSSCSYDSLTLNGRGVQCKTCGNYTDRWFSTSTNVLDVYFRTDGSVVSRGFRLDFRIGYPSYTTLTRSTCPGYYVGPQTTWRPFFWTAVANITASQRQETSTVRRQDMTTLFLNTTSSISLSKAACHGGVNIYDDYREITSPNFPALYSPSGNCVWRIYAPSNMVINVEVDVVKTESSNYLYLYDNWRSCYLRGDYQTGFNFSTRYNQLHLQLYKRYSWSKSTFRLRYRFVRSNSVAAFPFLWNCPVPSYTTHNWFTRGITAVFHRQTTERDYRTTATSEMQSVHVYWLRKAQGTDYPVRLVNGTGNQTGLVEIYNEGLGGWGTVCGYSWDARDARVVCAQLGFRGYARPTYNSSDGQLLMGSVDCSGLESSLDRCTHNGWNRGCWGSMAAGVDCSTTYNMWDACPGKLFIFEDGVEITSPNYPSSYTRYGYCIWTIYAPVNKTINVYVDVDNEQGNYLYLYDDRMSCVMRGYHPSGFYFTTSRNGLHLGLYSYSSGAKNNFRLRYRFVDSDQGTTYQNLSACPSPSTSTQSHQVTTPYRHQTTESNNVITYAQPVSTVEHLRRAQGTNYPVRLVNGNGTGVGRVEIYVQDHGGWGIVCDDSWAIQDAQVVCRQLGFSRALRAVQRSLYGYGNGQHRMDDVSCTGSESSLDRCRHNGWNNENCGNSEAAGVVCDNSSQTTEWQTTTRPWSNTETTEWPTTTNHVPWSNTGINITNVRCDSDYLEIEIRSTARFPARKLWQSTLADPRCHPVRVTANTAVLRTRLGDCSTRRVETNDAITYFNELMILRPVVPGAIINRHKDIQIPFECILSRHAKGSNTYRIGFSGPDAPVVGHGEYSLRLEFFTDNMYRQRVNSYPFYMDIDDPLYVMLRLVSSDRSLKISPKNCWATPDGKPYSIQYSLISNRCPADPTVVIDLVNSDLDKFKFSLRSFEFINRTDVYIHCDVTVCDLKDTDGQCQQSCGHKKKRSTNLAKDSVELAQGPLVLASRNGDVLKRTDGAPPAGTQAVPALVGTVVLMGLVVCALLAVALFRRKMSPRLNGYAPVTVQ